VRLLAFRRTVPQARAVLRGGDVGIVHRERSGISEDVRAR